MNLFCKDFAQQCLLSWNVVKQMPKCHSREHSLTYFVSWSITVWLTSCLTGLDLAKRVNVLWIKRKQSSWILTSKTGGQPYTDSSSCKVLTPPPGPPPNDTPPYLNKKSSSCHSSYRASCWWTSSRSSWAQRRGTGQKGIRRTKENY